MIPFLDVGAAYRELQSEIDSAVLGVMQSGWYIGGQEVERFESEFAAYTGANHCVSVANGLDALHLALRALDIQDGDEVIVPSNTFIATWLAISHCGARPVPVEPIEATYNIDPDRIEAAITKRTKAIVPVHLYGQPAHIDQIREIARKHGLHVLEDAAQAHGARYKGRRIGGDGEVVAWSFYPGKNLGALGDGGAITTNSAEISDRVRVLRNYGSNIKYVHEVKGYNSRLDPMQAVALRIKLPVLDQWNERRVKISRLYSDGLSGLDLLLPFVPEWASPAWHLYVIRHESRDRLASALRKEGIETLVHYPVPPHLQQAYRCAGFVQGQFPVTEKIAGELLSLPIGPHLCFDDVATIITAIKNVAK